MRNASIAILSILLMGGCMRYAGHRNQPPSRDRQDLRHGDSVPGKILVRDVHTGEVMLIDDPNQPPPEAKPYPAPPQDRRVASPSRAHPAPRPRPGTRQAEQPVRRRVSRRPEISFAFEGWATGLGGTMTGHEGWNLGDVDFESLDLDAAVAGSIRFDLAFRKGPTFSLGVTSAVGGGEMEAADIPFPDTPPVSSHLYTDLRLLMVDLDFYPVKYRGRWGRFALHTGLRYGRSVIDIEGESDFRAEGVMLTLGGGLDFRLFKNLLAMDLGGKVGLGADSAFVQFDLGVSLTPSERFHMRLGYRAFAMALIDRMDAWDERSVGLGGGGPALEMGFTF